jgi:hypothetical protein
MFSNLSDPEVAFTAVNTAAFVGWLMLVAAPRWHWTKALVLSGIFPLALAACYWFLLGLTLLQGAPEGAGFDSLEAVSLLFASPWGLLAGWVHYLCFDMVVGLVIQERLGHRPIIRIPCLVLTFLVGPVGWSLAWLVLRQQGDNAHSTDLGR